MVIAGVLAAGAAPPAGAAELPASGVIDLGADANLVATGAAAGDDAGWAVTPVGDVNGDGRPDVAVGAPRADVAVAGGEPRKDAGAVYVLYGPFPKQPALVPLTLGALDAVHGARIDGARAGERLGTSIAPAGDVDGDGRADLIVGAPAVVAGGRGPGAGRAYVVFAKALVPAGRSTSRPSAPSATPPRRTAASSSRARPATAPASPSPASGTSTATDSPSSRSARTRPTPPVGWTTAACTS
jgi:hypothetical protein